MAELITYTLQSENVRLHRLNSARTSAYGQILWKTVLYKVDKYTTNQIYKLIRSRSSYLVFHHLASFRVIRSDKDNLDHSKRNSLSGDILV